MSESTQNRAEVLRTYADYERQVTLGHLRVGCGLVMALMPLGVALDYCVYREQVGLFLILRLACVLMAAATWGILRMPISRKYHRALGVIIALLPVFFICWMIAVTDGAASPYYAGLTLILLSVAFVMRWSVGISALTLVLILAMYLGACAVHAFLLKPEGDLRILCNNLYFLSLTGIIVLTGSHVHRVLREREFSLRYELDQSRKALEESNQKLIELDQIKNRFFANISHELRTPLTLLLAPLETLLHRRNFPLNDESRQMLQTMHANGMRLLKLINDLLDLVRLESGRIEVKREPVEAAEFIRGIVSAARQMADDKRLHLVASVDPGLGAVLADRDKLEKIVLNLVFNALKFTPSGGQVTLQAARRAQEFVLMVADTGVGISQKNLPHIFDRFWQADGASNRKFQGVGIGLALVKELVEVQGGKVEVQSLEGKGTTFTVLLPYRAAERVQKPAPAAAPSDAAPDGEPAEGTSVTSEEWLASLYRRAELFPALTPLQEPSRIAESPDSSHLPVVLVADDEPDMRRFLKSQLKGHYQVLEAADGQQAVDKASQFLPDLVLLDMMMPGKDGLQACREIRAHTPTQTVPIIMLTARADEETKLGALSAGANDFLAKPFSTTELHLRLKNLVESHDYQRKLARQNQVLESTIEQLKETETQLVQTEKLASLGRMSAGIIHEINNPLNFATTGIYTLRKNAKQLPSEAQAEYEEVLSDVEEGLKRVKTIVSDLRMFTHPETESREAVDLALVVAASLRFLSNELKDKVKVEQHLAPAQTAWANKNRLIHVLVNLLQNALDALHTKSFQGEQPTIWIEGRIEGDKSLLVLRDNGTGIDSKHLDKIFDPFFTTKDVGKGMGLGLSICYRIVQECHGRISVRTEPGRFCEFTLEFPLKG